MRRMNSFQFECKYLQFHDLSKEKIEDEMVNTYVDKKFKWKKVKTNYFLEKNKVRDIHGILGYSDYPLWQQKAVNKTSEFIKFCQEKSRKEMKFEK